MAQGKLAGWGRLLRLCAATAALVVLALSVGVRSEEPQKPERIVVNDSGGAMGTWMRKAYF
ncbi:MAG TPA: hypothetical protein VEK12_08155, partial [Alphaproteobacteria bacterium]|nr:hypothetical protein [Alphaproteobacteria bacterium]